MKEEGKVAERGRGGQLEEFKARQGEGGRRISH